MSTPDDELACREVVELVTDYFEGRLEAGERLRLEAHLAACTGCRVYVEQMRTTLSALGRVPPDALSPDARERLLQLYRAWRAG